MESTELKIVQQKELELLHIVQKICKENGLTYFAIGGTCIGAIRHKGFIPWDDDIDIALPFEDYLVLKQKLCSELSAQYACHDEHEKREVVRFFMKLSDESTTAIKTNQLEYPDSYIGVHIDIMPLYGLPQSKAKRNLIFWGCCYTRLMNLLLRYPIKRFNRLSMKVLWVLNLPKKRFLPFEYYANKREKKYGSYAFDSSDCIMFPWRAKKGNRKRTIFHYDDFKEAKEVEFEDGFISVPIGYDSYLKQDFGDYMKLPPEEEQVAHIWGKLEMDKSYLEYVREGIK